MCVPFLGVVLSCVDGLCLFCFVSPAPAVCVLFFGGEGRRVVCACVFVGLLVLCAVVVCYVAVGVLVCFLMLLFLFV